jgi:shikimate dehydrogenase
MTDRYAVIGNPVAHSKSPLIHAEFARRTGQDMSYGKLLAAPGAFADTVLRFRDQGGRGLNVTVPFKLEAFDLADPAPRALLAQAVNTLGFIGEKIIGDNTDGVGLVRDIENNLGFALAGKRVLLMGAGGAARGVLYPLLERAPAQLVLANRSADKAQRLVAGVRVRRADSIPVSSSTYEALADCAFDVVINATAASLAGEVPPLPPGVFAGDALAYDMMYASGLTPFLKFAQAQGVRSLADGLGMLVEQAAESFLLWRAIRPDTRGVAEMLRSVSRPG